MIQVENLTKVYGATKAIDTLNFTIERGEIVGFLGPNGAGKSTTMRILAGAMGADEGRAVVDGIDVFKKPKAVKRVVGYLPEQPPLYTDMTVRGYLTFCARIKGASKPKESVEEAIADVGLTDVAHRLIDHLSKGFRQRVGIAQALVHKPKVLILDEPASGLDPAQRREIRALVKRLSEGDTTVILSTHVLQEVEAICDRVIIIHKGQIQVQDKLSNLAGTASTVRLHVARPSDDLSSKLSLLDGVERVIAEPDGHYVVHTLKDVREPLSRLAVEAGLLEFGSRQALEDIFLAHTGGAA